MSKPVVYVGVTGTNGKTSVTHFLAQALHLLGARPFVIGTVGHGLWPDLKPDGYTTPPADLMAGYLADIQKSGATHVLMEVSSHALVQHRVDTVPFDIAVLTNLTQDHLDYHKSMGNYVAAKAKLFAWPSLQYIVMNQDDPSANVLTRHVLRSAKCDKPKKITYAQKSQSDIHILSTEQNALAQLIQLKTPQGQFKTTLNLLGEFNVDNVMAVASVLHALSFSNEDMATVLPKLKPVKGRLEMHTQTGRATAVIDYAHTPDALEKALTALRSFCSGKLWVVFGCGGDRDKTKRPLMAEVAERLADVVVVTEDNARTECRANIVKDIVAGLQQPEKAHIKPNRKVAIQFALAHAALGDMVLLAGKGHETTLNIRGRLYHFDERQFL